MNKIINNTLKISFIGACFAIIGCSHTDSDFKDHIEKNTSSYYIKMGNDCTINKEYEEAFNHYKTAADRGNALAKRHVGFCYYTGKGVAQDYEQARIYFGESAAKGNTVSMYYLGDIYLEGKGVEKDFAKAMEYFHKAASLKNEYAETRLALLNYYGAEGVYQDYEVAYEYFKKATRHGYSQAQFNMGVVYFLGHGATKSEAEALHWMELAAGNGHEKAKEFLSKTPEERAAMDLKPYALH